MLFFVPFMLLYNVDLYTCTCIHLYTSIYKTACGIDHRAPTSSRVAGAYMSVAMAMSVRPYCSISMTTHPGTHSKRRPHARLAWNITLGSTARQIHVGMCTCMYYTCMNTLISNMYMYIHIQCTSHSLACTYCLSMCSSMYNTCMYKCTCR